VIDDVFVTVHEVEQSADFGECERDETSPTGCLGRWFGRAATRVLLVELFG